MKSLDMIVLCCSLFPWRSNAVKIISLDARINLRG